VEEGKFKSSPAEPRGRRRTERERNDFCFAFQAKKEIKMRDN